jgi:hypothetical protein
MTAIGMWGQCVITNPSGETLRACTTDEQVPGELCLQNGGIYRAVLQRLHTQRGISAIPERRQLRNKVKITTVETYFLT